MNDDPRRLIDEAGDFEQSLLRSAAADGPGDRKRLARAIAVAAASGAVMGGSAAASSGAVIAKWIVVAVVGSGVAVGVGYKTHQLHEWHRGVAPMVAPVAPVVPAPPPPIVAPVAPPPPPSGEPRHAKETPSLERELALIDGARRSLDAGHGKEALAELTRYEHRFKRGVMAPEVTMLRVECLVRLGQRDKARALAHRFLAAHPESPLGGRVRTLIGD